MDNRKEGIRRFSVPAFGEWDGKVGMPDYSVDFSRIREHRRLSKSRVSLGNEEDLLNNSKINDGHSSESLEKKRSLHRHGNCTMIRKKISGYFICYGCMGS